MELDFDIETNSQPIEFEFMSSNTEGTGGISENRVQQIVEEKTKDLQPKTDETLETNTKQVVGAINEVNSGLVKEMGSSVNEETNVLTIELKDKSGKVIANTEVTIPKGEVPDLSAYVKNTDYASNNKAGVVKTSNTRGTSASTVNGILQIEKANKDEILAKFSGYKPIVPNTLDYAVKVGITTNTETLTDEEKTSARTWIGAVGNTDAADNVNEQYGLVKLKNNGQGGLKVGSGGFLNVQPPSTALLRQRDVVRPLVSANIGEIMRLGVTGLKDTWNGKQMVASYGNQIPLTDEEKTSACDWLGAVTKKELGDINTALEAILGV